MQLVRKIYLLFSGEKCYYRNMSEQNIEKNNYIKESSVPEKRRNCLLPCFSDQKRQAYQSWQFPRCLQAHRAYEQGLLLLSDPSLTLQSYEKVSPLSFEKWVSLINLRDNGLYIGNPIYLGQQLFYYYLSPPPCLKIRHGRPVLLFFP